MALLILGLGVRAPQRLWHLAAEPQLVTTWPRALAVEAAERAGSARSWVARLHSWVVST
jgi:hypothetical protein